MITYIVSEQKKILRSPAFWVTLGLSILMSVGLIIVMRYVFMDPDIASQSPVNWSMEQLEAASVIFWPMSLISSLQKVLQSAPLFIPIFLGATFAKEYAWGTLKVPLTRGVSRHWVLISRMLSLLLPSLLVAVIAPLLVECGLSLLITKSLAGSRPDFAYSINNLSLLSVVGVLPYYFLGFLLTVIGRSPVVTIGGGIGFMLVEGIAVGALAGLKVFRYMPSALSKNLLAAQATQISLLGILLWSVALGLAALIIFKRQDISD